MSDKVEARHGLADGLSGQDLVDWYNGSPSRKELYKVLTLHAHVQGHVLTAIASLAADDVTQCFADLNKALRAMSELQPLYPNLSKEQLDELGLEVVGEFGNG